MRSFTTVLIAFSACVSVVGCSPTKREGAPIPTTNYLKFDLSSADMLPPWPLCFYVLQYPTYRDIPGQILIGHVERVLTEDESNSFRRRFCFDGFTACWYSPVIEVSVKTPVAADAVVGEKIQFEVGPMSRDDAAKLFEGKELFVSMRRFSVDDTAGWGSVHSTFVIDGDWVFALSQEGLSQDFGSAAVSVDQLVAKVKEILSSDVSSCKIQSPSSEEVSEPVNDNDVKGEQDFGPKY